jgi:hypothetical protein
MNFKLQGKHTSSKDKKEVPIKVKWINERITGSLFQKEIYGKDGIPQNF